MDQIVFESMNKTIASMIEQCLKDNNIPFTTTGQGRTEFSDFTPVQIRVSEKDFETAKDLVEQLTKA